MSLTNQCIRFWVWCRVLEQEISYINLELPHLQEYFKKQVMQMCLQKKRALSYIRKILNLLGPAQTPPYQLFEEHAS